MASPVNVQSIKTSEPNIHQSMVSRTCGLGIPSSYIFSEIVLYNFSGIDVVAHTEQEISSVSMVNSRDESDSFPEILAAFEIMFVP